MTAAWYEFESWGSKKSTVRIENAAVEERPGCYLLRLKIGKN
jgi:hypothetical protein